jgi:hypothetical protein
MLALFYTVLSTFFVLPALLGPVRRDGDGRLAVRR